jgi:F0F1-type ATP synthase beta subunit
MTTIRNSFHRTTARTLKSKEELAAIVASANTLGVDQLEAHDRRLVKRLRAQLCPSFECHCATSIFGERG